MDKAQWVTEYRRLLQVYNKKADTEQADAYFAALSDLSGEAVAEGVSRCIREGRFWPSVADIRERAIVRGGDGRPGWTCRECGGTGLVTVTDDHAHEKHLADAMQIVYLRSQRRSRAFPNPLTQTEALAWVQNELAENRMRFGTTPVMVQCPCRKARAA